MTKQPLAIGIENYKEIISILNENYAKYFGFTQTEVEKMLSYYGISEKKEDFYHGFLLGLLSSLKDTEIWNLLLSEKLQMRIN